MLNNPLRGLQQQRAFVTQTRENSTRFAQTFGRFTTTGWGEVAFEDMFDFGLSFIEEPFVAYSSSIDSDALIDTRFPRATGGVYRWKQDKRGFYVGAWCYTTIETKSPNIATTEAEPNYSLVHYYSFSGKAIKDLGIEHLVV